MMRKLFPAMIMAVTAIGGFASCNKDYTCTCTVNSSGSTYVISSDIGTTTKGDARNQCDALRTHYTDSASAVSSTCHL